MNASLSVWMDLCRVLAAAVVFVGHARGLGLAPEAVAAHWHRTAEDAVDAFFVISGYVIAWSTARAGSGMRDYVEARASRVYSVAVPAVLMALAMDLVGMRFDASLYDADWQYPRLWLYLPLHWAFLGGTWIGPMDPFSMASYWSLPYEVWYYALFGCATLLTGVQRRIGVTVVMALMGPRMWLLLPCWWLGVLLHAHLDRWRMNAAAARLLMGFAVMTYVVFVASGGRASVDLASKHLYTWFNTWLPLPFVRGGTVHALSDYVVVVLFGLFLVGCASARINFGRHSTQLIRSLAGYTFSLYLIHYSLLVLLGAMGVAATDWIAFAGVMALTALLTWGLAQVGEMRRSVYRRAVVALLDLGLCAVKRLRSIGDARPG